MTEDNKPIIQATLGDLKEMIEDMFATPTNYPHDKPPEVKNIWFMDWQDWLNCLEYVNLPLQKLKAVVS